MTGRIRLSSKESKISRLEKVELQDGSIYILDNARLVSRWPASKILVGSEVKPDGAITHIHKEIDYTKVKRHVAMEFDLMKRKLVEKPADTPFSLQNVN